MSLQKIISGGQTGADIAGIDAAIENGMLYGGWLPKGRKTENGPLDSRYSGMTEMPVGRYLERTERNVKDSDGTVIFTHGKLPGGWSLLNEYATKHNKPLLHLDLDVFSEPTAVETISEWIDQHGVQTLNVGGSQASKDEYIYDDVHSIIKTLINKTKAAEFSQNQQTPPVENSSLHATSPPQDTEDDFLLELEELIKLEQSEGTESKLEESEGAGSKLEQAKDPGPPPLIAVLPKVAQKKALIYLSLGILAIAAAVVVLPGVLKNSSSEKITANTPEKSSEMKTVAKKLPEPVPQSIPALPSTTSLPEKPVDQDLSVSAPKTPPEPQTEILVTINAESKTDNRSPAVDQPEKTGHEGESAQTNGSPGQSLANNTAANGSLESLSDTPQETEKKPAPVKKPPASDKNRCASLYKKMAVGNILDKEETDFLSQNCN